ncbi:MarR family winged helix-turn-helix transcriptional regulator [Halomonas pacifica]|uniref:MarR family transcriptional regulator n=1 Tax=Bisbaumannia pacifica TaxID=77098 RepID=A0A510XAQ9_9GAMM|nr:MarR family winged helix-turn-helix transcriptional regulator [Halomonas pacifica]MBH8579246.1 winged helix-turn-helix transcriptional regulator [Halomonas pacifica]MDC8801997.1 MarR family winged helix-turn-helix transcriptional regulator [Halomonas pacifica]GEK48509.1 MarR family transcriptional regulator [Halomonas pacifica]
MPTETTVHGASSSDHRTPAEQEYDFSEQVGHLLRKAYQRHTSIFQRLSCDKQLTAIQFVTLCTIMERGPSSLTEIVHATAIDPATIRGVIKRLKAREWVTLTTDPGDQRKVMVVITEAGESLVETMVPIAKQISDQTMNNLNPAERIALLHLLEKMNADG